MSDSEDREPEERDLRELAVRAHAFADWPESPMPAKEEQETEPPEAT